MAGTFIAPAAPRPVRTFFLSLLVVIAVLLLPAAGPAGVEYRSYEAPGGSTVHVVSTPWPRADAALRIGLAEGFRHYEQRETVSSIASHHERMSGERVLAAINGSFFGDGSSITGPLASDGELIVLPNPQGGQEVFAILADETPVLFDWIRTAGVELTAGGQTHTVDRFNQVRQPDTLAVYTDRYAPRTGNVDAGVELPVTGLSGPVAAGRRVTGTAGRARQTRGEGSAAIPGGGLVFAAREARTAALDGIEPGMPVEARVRLTPLQFHGVDLMIAGMGSLLRGGEVQHDRWDYQREFLGPQPRSAVAFNGERLFFVAVDGRGAGGSPGMTLGELAEFLRDELGAVEALNLDGGASSTLLAEGRRVNRPAGFGMERPVANALLLVERPQMDLPFTEDFAGGRSGPWRDLFTPGEVEETAGRMAMTVRDPAGGTDAASIRFMQPADYRVEALVHFPEALEQGFERIGLFARDDGRGAFVHPELGGAALAITWDTDDGRLRAGSIKDGEMLDSLPEPRFFRERGWHQLAIECEGGRVRYYLNGELILQDNAQGRAYGGAGIGHREYLPDPAQSHGARVAEFRIVPLSARAGE